MKPPAQDLDHQHCPLSGSSNAASLIIIKVTSHSKLRAWICAISAAECLWEIQTRKCTRIESKGTNLQTHNIHAYRDQTKLTDFAHSTPQMSERSCKITSARYSSKISVTVFTPLSPCLPPSSDDGQPTNYLRCLHHRKIPRSSHFLCKKKIHMPISEFLRTCFAALRGMR